MITALVGRPGEGKSVHGAMMIRDLLDAGHQVYTNLHCFETRPGYHYFDTDSYEVIYELQDGVIIFDEGQFILDARNWQNLPAKFRQLLQKGRHEGLDFHVLTQNIMQIDVSARRLVHEAQSVSKLFISKKWGFGIFLLRDIDISGLDAQKVTGWPLPSVVVQSDFDYYDTHFLGSQHTPPPQIVCGICGSLHQIIPRSSLRSDRTPLAEGRRA